MAKGVSAKEYRNKSNADLLTDLKKLREDLQNIRFSKQSGTAVAKLSKIKNLRKQIARVLTIIREKKKEEVIKNLRTKVTKEKKDDKEEEGKFIFRLIIFLLYFCVKASISFLCWAINSNICSSIFVFEAVSLLILL